MNPRCHVGRPVTITEIEGTKNINIVCTVCGQLIMTVATMGKLPRIDNGIPLQVSYKQHSCELVVSNKTTSAELGKISVALMQPM